MSKLNENWQKLRPQIGQMINQIQNTVDKYDSCEDITESAYIRGYNKAIGECNKKTKDELCKDCRHKLLDEKVKKYKDLIEDFGDLTYQDQSLIKELVEKLKIQRI